jgi:hypothetical protein
MGIQKRVTQLKAHISEFIQKHQFILVHVALFVAQTLWGGLTVWNKGALESGMHASAFIVFRLGISVIIFHLGSLLFYREDYLKIPPKKDITHMGLLGLLVATFSALVSQANIILPFFAYLHLKNLTKLLFFLLFILVYIRHGLHYRYQ